MTYWKKLTPAFLALSLLISAPALSFAQSDAEAGKPAGEASLPSPDDLLKILPTDHVQGNKNAKLLVIEYGSLSCSHCMHLHGETYPQLKKAYIDTGKIAYVFRNFPFNEPALRGGMLTECSGDRFYTFLTVLFNAQPQWAYTQEFRENLETIAKVGGIGKEEFETCLNDKALEARLIQQAQLGADVLKVHSTPTLFVGKEQLTGFQSFEALSKVIEQHLK